MKRPRKDRRKEEKQIFNHGQSSTNSENQAHSDVIPLDLIIEILSKLPARSLARFVCVSKVWASIIRSQGFINSFQNRSSTQPCILFTLGGVGGDQLFFSSSPLEQPIFSISRTNFMIPRNGFMRTHSVGGLILGNASLRLVLCNPTTGHIRTLPKVRSRRHGITSFLGYDPIDHQYKVLCMTQLAIDYHRNDRRVAAGEHQILTFGDEQSWRMIECSTPHCPATDSLCINGIVYYGAFFGTNMEECVVVCFHVMSEKFGLVNVAEDFQTLNMSRSTLINYQGKVALADDGPPSRIDLWVLEDAEKHEWSKLYVFLYPLAGLDRNNRLYATGTIHTGEIILAPFYLCHPFYVICYDVERNSIRRVVIEQIADDEYRGLRRIFTFPDHAESIMLL